VRRQLGDGGAVRWQVKRRHPPHRLAPHPQRLPAGRDDPQPRTPGQQQLHQRGAVADLVLAGISAGKLTINVLGDRLLTTQTTDVTEGTQQVRIPVGKDWGTGAYVLATLRRPLDATALRMPEGRSA